MLLLMFLFDILSSLSYSVSSISYPIPSHTLAHTLCRCFCSCLVMSCLSLYLAITDQGVGISPENQQNLFQNFVQIRPTTLQAGQGSGLGLALCKVRHNDTPFHNNDTPFYNNNTTSRNTPMFSLQHIFSSSSPSP